MWPSNLSGLLKPSLKFGSVLTQGDYLKTSRPACTTYRQVRVICLGQYYCGWNIPRISLILPVTLFGCFFISVKNVSSKKSFWKKCFVSVILGQAEFWVHLCGPVFCFAFPPSFLSHCWWVLFPWWLKPLKRRPWNVLLKTSHFVVL